MKSLFRIESFVNFLAKFHFTSAPSSMGGGESSAGKMNGMRAKKSGAGVRVRAEARDARPGVY